MRRLRHRLDLYFLFFKLRWIIENKLQLPGRRITKLHTWLSLHLMIFLVRIADRLINMTTTFLFYTAWPLNSAFQEPRSCSIALNINRWLIGCVIILHQCQWLLHLFYCLIKTLLVTGTFSTCESFFYLKFASLEPWNGPLIDYQVNEFLIFR